MKIRAIRVLPPHMRGMALVEVQTDEGLSGIGLTQAPAEVIEAILNAPSSAMAALLIGENPLQTGRLWRRMFVDWQAQVGRASEGGLAVNAMAAVDMALWDLAGKARGEPIHRLLGGALRDRVMAYASATALQPVPGRPYEWTPKSSERLTREAAEFVRRGFRAIKLGWGSRFGAEDLARLAAVREAIGPDTRLMIDIGCPGYWQSGWTAKQTARAIDRCDALDLYFVEEPVPPYDVAGYAEVTRRTRPMIAGGESLTTVDQFSRFIDRSAVDIVQPDAAQMGVTQCVAVARAADRAGLICIPHSPWSALAVAAHTHLLATINHATMVEYPALDSADERANRRTKKMHEEVIEQPLELEDGYVALPQGPGLGLGGWRREAIEELAEL